MNKKIVSLVLLLSSCVGLQATKYVVEDFVVGAQLKKNSTSLCNEWKPRPYVDSQRRHKKEEKKAIREDRKEKNERINSFLNNN